MSDIRTATADDIAALHALIEGAYRGESAKAGWTHEADLLGGQRTDPEALAEIIGDPAQTVLVAETDTALTGCVVVTDKGGGLAYFGLLSVDPRRQAGGLGRRLIDAAEAHARAHGCDTMEITVIAARRELIAYYERRGYALTGERRPFPLDDERFGVSVTRDLEFVVMAKPLSK